MNRFLICTLLIFSTACEQKELGESLNSAQSQAQAALDHLKSQNLDQQALAELEKLNTFEYVVKSFSDKLSDTELSTELATLGKEGWECFNVSQASENYRVWCKRRPKTYLRYLNPVL